MRNCRAHQRLPPRQRRSAARGPGPVPADHDGRSGGARDPGWPGAASPLSSPGAGLPLRRTRCETSPGPMDATDSTSGGRRSTQASAGRQAGRSRRATGPRRGKGDQGRREARSFACDPHRKPRPGESSRLRIIRSRGVKLRTAGESAFHFTAGSFRVESGGNAGRAFCRDFPGSTPRGRHLPRRRRVGEEMYIIQKGRSG